MGLWVCKNCQHVGGAITRPGSSLPACSACGHSTIVPVATPKGQEIARKAGLDVDAALAEEDRRIAVADRWNWQKGMITKGAGVLGTGFLAGTCAMVDSTGGIMFWGFGTVLLVGAMVMGYVTRPPRGT